MNFLLFLTLKCFIACVCCNNEEIFIKWITNTHLPSMDDVLELENVLPNSLSDDFLCYWYKMSSKRVLIDESDYETQLNYIYKTSRSFCNLLIVNYNFETNEQIDFYKGNIKSKYLVGESIDVVYALAYLKSFELIANGDSLYPNYKCQAVFIFPFSDILNEFVKDAIKKNVILRGDFKSTEEILKIKKTYKSKRETEEEEDERFLEYTIESDFVDVIKLSENEAFTCELQLFDASKNSSLYYKKFIHEELNILPENGKERLLIFPFFFLFFILQYNLVE